MLALYHLCSSIGLARWKNEFDSNLLTGKIALLDVSLGMIYLGSVMLHLSNKRMEFLTGLYCCDDN